MIVQTIKELLNAEIICGSDKIDKNVNMGCGCDLMSHVLAHIHHDDALLLTGLTTPQVIHTTHAVDIEVICFVRGKRPEESTIQLAHNRNMVLLCTDLPLYESCGRLYKGGLIGCSEYAG